MQTKSIRSAELQPYTLNHIVDLQVFAAAPDYRPAAAAALSVVPAVYDNESGGIFRLRLHLNVSLAPAEEGRPSLAAWLAGISIDASDGWMDG